MDGSIDPRPPRGVVYTTGVGRVCPECGRPVAECGCATAKAASVPADTAGERVVRIRRDRKDRRGKTVTVLEGLAVPPAELARIASELKRACGAGGTVVDGAIEIQGDHGDRLESELTARGFRVKRVGG